MSNQREIIIGTLAAFIISFSSAFAIFKVPPQIQSLMTDFGLTYTLAGFFMGLVGLSIVVSSIPGGLIIARYGPKKIGLAAILLVIVGGLIQVIPQSIYLLFIGRIIEGVGISLGLVSAPTIISALFPPNKRGFALGLYLICYPLGSVVAMNVSLVIPLGWGWRIIWWLSLCVTLASLTALLYTREIKVVQSTSRVSIRRAISNPLLWILPLANMGIGSPGNSLMNWGPTYLNLAHGIAVPLGSLLVSLTMLMAIPISPIGGWLADKVRPRKLVYAFPLLALAILYPSIPYIPFSIFLIMMLVIGFFNNIVPPAVMADIVEVAGPEATSIGFGIITTMVNIGIMVSSPLFGFIYDTYGSWNLCFLSLAIYDILGFLSTIPKRTK
jgi:predicted MFS family arabinose efflux permease